MSPPLRGVGQPASDLNWILSQVGDMPDYVEDECDQLLASAYLLACTYSQALNERHSVACWTITN
jgi:hypothetical protein